MGYSHTHILIKCKALIHCMLLWITGEGIHVIASVKYVIVWVHCSFYCSFTVLYYFKPDPKFVNVNTLCCMCCVFVFIEECLHFSQCGQTSQCTAKTVLCLHNSIPLSSLLLCFTCVHKIPVQNYVRIDTKLFVCTMKCVQCIFITFSAKPNFNIFYSNNRNVLDIVLISWQVNEYPLESWI